MPYSAVRCRQCIGVSAELSGYEAGIGTEQYGRRSPSSLSLHPEQVRPPAQVEAGEGVPQSMWCESAIPSQSLADCRLEDPVAEVGLVDESAVVVGEDQGLVTVDVGPVSL